jgi:hypothetical protein
MSIGLRHTARSPTSSASTSTWKCSGADSPGVDGTLPASDSTTVKRRSTQWYLFAVARRLLPPRAPHRAASNTAIHRCIASGAGKDEKSRV